jgi:uncharacterized membrane protein
VRDHVSGSRADPTTALHPEPVLFFLRWVTHFCAPTFIFLAGTSAYFYGKKASGPSPSRFLWTRGLWLVLLEVLIVRQGWTFSLSPQLGVVLQVIWVIGASMIVLAALVRLPLPWVVAIGLAVVLLHNLLDGVDPKEFGALEPWFRLLHVQGPVSVLGLRVLVVYPLVPWFAVMALGFACGAVLERPRPERARLLLGLGLGLCVGFALLRGLNLYGEPHPWAAAASLGESWMKALATTKYPPSLHYLLMTLGPMLCALGLLERFPALEFPRLLVLGRVPLFLYVTHIYLAHALALLLGTLSGFAPARFLAPFFEFPAGYGYGPASVLLVWVLVLVLLYPACRWYARTKQTRRSAILSYL